MTAHAELERSATDGNGRPARLPRSPAMQSYCATLSRFTSSVQSTELMLRNNEAGTREDREQLEVAADSRLRGIDKARVEAEAGLEHSSAVRRDHGLPPPEGERRPAGLRPSNRSGAADLGIALTSLARRRDELRSAEAEFQEWLRAEDDASRTFVLTATGIAGVIAAAIMFVAGSTTSAGGSLTLLIMCTLAVMTTGLSVAVTRRLPQACSGQDLGRVPHAVSMLRLGAGLAGTTAVGLVVVNIVGASL